MKPPIVASLPLVVAVAALVGTTATPPACAQLYRDLGRQGAVSRPESAREHFVGFFRNARTGDAYRFRANGTYTFAGGRAARRTGNIGHSGTWRILDFYEGSSDSAPNMGTLRLRATRRTVLQRKPRVLRTPRTYQVPMSLSMEDGVIFIRQQRFDAVS